MANIKFEETKNGNYRSRDGRFLLQKSQHRHGYQFLIMDMEKDPHGGVKSKVGITRSMSKAVSLIRKHLLEEKSKELSGQPISQTNPATGQPLEPRLTSPSKITDYQAKRWKPGPAQAILATCASLADKEGVFTTSESKISSLSGVNPSSVNNYMRRFVIAGWIVVLESGRQTARPSTYGFGIPKEKVHELLKDMPPLPNVAEKEEKSVKTEVTEVRHGHPNHVLETVQESILKPDPIGHVNQPKPVPVKPGSEAGIMAGKAMIKIIEVSVEVDQLKGMVRELTSMISDLRQISGDQNKINDMINKIVEARFQEYEGLVDNLENTVGGLEGLLRDTFGLELKK